MKEIEPMGELETLLHSVKDVLESGDADDFHEEDRMQLISALSALDIQLEKDLTFVREALGKLMGEGMVRH